MRGINKMEFERQIVSVGGSVGITLPPDLLKFLKLNAKDIVIIQDENGKHGNYITIWKKPNNDIDTNSTE